MFKINIIHIFLLIIDNKFTSSLQIYENLGVKTTYVNSFIGVSLESDLYNYSKCTPLHYSSVHRHGIRNPGNKDIDRIDALFIAITRESQRLDRVALLYRPFTGQIAKMLTYGGRIELRIIANRTRARFPTLFDDPSLSVYIASSLQRAKDSAAAYRDGLGDATSAVHVRDDLMRYYYRCKQVQARFRRSRDKPSYSKMQFNDFWRDWRVENIAAKIRKYLDASNLLITAS